MDDMVFLAVACVNLQVDGRDVLRTRGKHSRAGIFKPHLDLGSERLGMSLKPDFIV
jgi:hypothetical protein